MVKICSRCKEEKPIEMFYADKRASDGKRSDCKPCVNSSIKTYRRNNIEKMRVVKWWRGRYVPYKSNPLAQARRKQNQPEMSARNAAWRVANPDKDSAHRAVSLALKKGVITKPSICQSCGHNERLEGHHSDYQKLLDVIWLCKSCHDKLHLPYGFCKPLQRLRRPVTLDAVDSRECADLGVSE